MKKALYLHGFLGSSEDMAPLYLESCEGHAPDLRRHFFKENFIEELVKDLGSQYDFAVGYSFGGRVLERLAQLCPNLFSKLIYVSSRHSAYSKKELEDRKRFKKKLLSSLAFGEEEFLSYWRKLGLFSGHKMDIYRENHDLVVPRWSREEILFYLENFFTLPPVPPLRQPPAYFFYGEKDLKYKAEAGRIKKHFETFEFKGLGHRLLFEDPEAFKQKLGEVVQ